MQTFKVGEIAVLQNLRGGSARYNGAECEILEGNILRTGLFRCVTTGNVRLISKPAYWIRISNGHECFAEEFKLRKKQPPATFTGETRIAELFQGKPQLEEMACAA